MSSELYSKNAVDGRVFFMRARTKIKHMKLNINRTEVTGGSTSAKRVSEKETPMRFEALVGGPVRDQCNSARSTSRSTAVRRVLTTFGTTFREMTAGFPRLLQIRMLRDESEFKDLKLTVPLEYATSRDAS